MLHDRRPMILVTDTYSAASLNLLRMQLAAEIKSTASTTPNANELSLATALLIRSRTQITKQLLAQAPRLQVIVTATSGFDHIDLPACHDRGITVMYTPQANVESAAELTLLLMLSLSRNMPSVLANMKDNGWRDHVARGFSLQNKTLGLIGVGRIGQRVAVLAKALQMKLLGCDPYINEDVFTRLGMERVGFSELLRLSDFVSLHVPLTPETRHMISASTLAMMSTHSYLINTSRGAVVDENALFQALNHRQLAGAGLDVFENEPLTRESRLRHLKNVVLTPHIGAYTEDAWQQASEQAARQVIAFFKSDTLSNVL